MEVEILHVLELGSARRKQLFADLDVSVHGAADVEQQEQFDRIASLRAHLDVQQAAIACGVADGAVEVQLILRTLASELAQPAQGDLDIAGAQLYRVVEVLVFALLPHLDGLALTLAGIADANALRVVAARAKRAGAAGADPLVAAGMAFLLLIEALLERLDELVEATEGLDLCTLFVAQRALELLAQPLFGDQGFQVLVEVLQTLEVGGKGTVELVEMALILDQNGARQEVKLVHVGEHDVVLERIDQVEQFAQGNRHLGGAHLGEQVQQHAGPSVAVVDGQAVVEAVPVRLGTDVNMRLGEIAYRRIQSAQGHGQPVWSRLLVEPLQV